MASPRTLPKRLASTLSGAFLVIAAGLASFAPGPAQAGSTDYPAAPCCSLCPHAADPAAYDGSKFMNDFRVLVEGRDGWLFRTGLDLTTSFDVTDDSLWELNRLAQALRKRGTEVLMVYQPPRGLMDPDQLTPQQRSGYAFETARRNYAAALARLRTQGGVIVPPLDRLANEHKGYDYYFRRDHHWTPAGAEHTARLIADTLRSTPVFAGLPQKSFSTHEAGIIGEPGTLQKVAEQLCGGGYSMQYLQSYATDSADQGGGGSSLFGDAPMPSVTLVGTSNSDSKGGYNFSGYLEQYLGVDVLNVAITGGSFEGSLLHYLSSEQFQKHPPKLLIWELPYQDYPNADKNPHKIFRQVVALVNDGCHGKPAALTRTIPVQAGSNEMLFNGGSHILPLLSRDYQLDVSFSDPGIKDMHAEIWYFNGLKESLKLHFKPYVDNGGRFVAELRSDDPDYADATVMGITLEMDTAPAKPMTATAQLCARDDASPAARSLVATR